MKYRGNAFYSFALRMHITQVYFNGRYYRVGRSRRQIVGPVSRPVMF